MLQYFAPDYELDVRPSNMDNANTKEYLEKIRTQVIENLKRTSFAPSVQMTDVPREPLVEGMDDEADAILDDLDEDENKDKRMTARRFDRYVEKPGELSDSEDEEESAAIGVRRQANILKRRNEINYKHLDVGDSGLESGLATPREASSVADEEADLAGDAKMTEAPDVETTEDRGSPFAAEPPSRAEEASVAEPAEMQVDKLEEEPTTTSAAPSAPLSRQQSLKPQEEDTAMEDAQAPLAEPEHPKEVVPSETPEDGERPVEEAPAAGKAGTPGPMASPKEQSAPKEASEPVTDKVGQPESAEPAKEAGPTTEAAEPKEEPSEAPADKPTSEKTEPEEAGPEKTETEKAGHEAIGQEKIEQKSESGTTGAEASREAGEFGQTGESSEFKEGTSEQRSEDPAKAEA